MKNIRMFRKRNSGKVIRCTFLILLQTAIVSNCCVISKNKVTGRFHSFNISTTVDSKIAKYYLENYIADNKDDPDSDKRIDDINAEYDKETPSRDDLLAISKKTSVDFGALFFAEKVLKYRNNENLQKENASDKNILIAGASSAGPAIYLSLGKYLKKEETKRIKAWLNLGGILQGVPVLDQFLKGYKSLLLDLVIWIKNWKKSSFESMQTEVSRKRFSEIKLPENILVINYIGMSLSGNISKFAADKYCLMLDDGPNDGLSLLPDLIVPNTQTILAPESDHFFAEDPDIDRKTVAFLKTILERLRN